MDRNLVPARRQRFHQEHEGAFRPAQGPLLGRAAVEFDAVVGQNDTRHSGLPAFRIAAVVLKLRLEV